MEQSLSPDAAVSICKHMNDDHADAVASYARIYGKIANVHAAEIVAFDSHGMELRVDSGGERIRAHIPFDHVLRDTEDARTTLIEMARHAAGT
jgi:putative heme iron utilization protein